MPVLRRTLPPVNGLVVFEAAGRHLNFTRASEELALTQSAVSHQIRQIEEHLGVTLFQRQGRGLKLTREGDRLHRAVSMGLEHIAQVAIELRRHRGRADLTVASSVTFASYWLMARLARFRAANPAIELRLVAAAPIQDLAGAGIDLAVRYGDGRWPGTNAVKIFDNEIWPVCAPSYLADRARPSRVEDLLDETLLHLDRFDRNWVTWKAWLADHGVEEAPRRRGIEFGNYLVLLQGALRGEGVALCGRRLAEDFIGRGELVRPIEATMHSDRAFWLIYPKDLPLSPSAAAFRDWLVNEAMHPEEPSTGSAAHPTA
ncbi:MAG: LysR substrate-binding domain-containing protein [Geminicoccaceae bacterium]